MIAAIGSINVDYIIHNSRLPVPGETLYGKSATIMAGGKGANQIAAASRLGADTVFLSKIGELDQYNSTVLKDFEWAGVSTECIETVPDKYSGAGFAMIGEDSQNSIIIIEGANAEVTPEYVAKYKDQIKKASIVMCEFMIPQETAEYAMKLGKELGIPTLCNPAPFRKTDDSFYRYVDIVTPNEIEAAEACGFTIDDKKSAAEACDYFHSLGVKSVVITMGSRGAFCSDGGRQEMIESYKVKAIDTSGAGDSFNGGFAYAFDKGYDIFTCARFGNAVASKSVQRVGTMRSMPNLNETEEVYRLG